MVAKGRAHLHLRPGAGIAAAELTVTGPGGRPPQRHLRWRGRQPRHRPGPTPCHTPRTKDGHGRGRRFLRPPCVTSPTGSAKPPSSFPPPTRISSNSPARPPPLAKKATPSTERPLRPAPTAEINGFGSGLPGGGEQDDHPRQGRWRKTGPSDSSRIKTPKKILGLVEDPTYAKNLPPGVETHDPHRPQRQSLPLRTRKAPPGKRLSAPSRKPSGPTWRSSARAAASPIVQTFKDVLGVGHPPAGPRTSRLPARTRPTRTFR